MKQLLYNKFIINNCISFHLRWKENLVKHQKSQNIMVIIVCKNFFRFLFLLTAQIVNNTHIFAGISITFPKRRPRPNLKAFQYEI